MSNPIASRPQLGEFISIICFKSVITGMEEALGEKATAIALIAAGRARGKNLVKDLGLSNSNADFNAIAQQLDRAVGREGTRLTNVDKIIQIGEKIEVYCSEAVCNTGEARGSDRKCTFTMGGNLGRIERNYGQETTRNSYRIRFAW